jgi:two-component system, OmpR family, sensor kinase
VADDLTDPATEVGQVGAALNTLLDHVDDALEARHRSEQQVRQFVADASHELRRPLSTIHGYAELSRRTPDDAAALGGAMGKVETEAGRMSGLVEDLLLLARLDAGRPPQQRTWT